MLVGTSERCPPAEAQPSPGPADAAGAGRRKIATSKVTTATVLDRGFEIVWVLSRVDRDNVSRRRGLSAGAPHRPDRWPAWIRTRTNRSRVSRATVTPRANDPVSGRAVRCYQTASGTRGTARSAGGTLGSNERRT